MKLRSAACAREGTHSKSSCQAAYTALSSVAEMIDTITEVTLYITLPIRLFWYQKYQ